jgi:AcrR family transcriptional regulator
VKKRTASNKGQAKSARLRANSQTSGEKRRQIITGALRVFLEHGYLKASMARVAEEAGVAKQTIYFYFKDKESLFESLIEELTESLFQREIRLEPTAADPSAYLMKMANNFFLQTDKWEYQSFFRLVIAESGRHPRLAQLYVCKVVEANTQGLVDYLNSHRDMHFSDPEATARAFRGSLASFALVQEILLGKYVMPMPRERFAKNLVDMVVSYGRQKAPQKKTR